MHKQRAIWTAAAILAALHAVLVVWPLLINPGDEGGFDNMLLCDWPLLALAEVVPNSRSVFNVGTPVYHWSSVLAVL